MIGIPTPSPLRGGRGPSLDGGGLSGEAPASHRPLPAADEYAREGN